MPVSVGSCNLVISDVSPLETCLLSSDKGNRNGKHREGAKLEEGCTRRA
jgi:hypothetical protein